MYTARAIADWADSIRLEHFPPVAVDLAKRSILDAMGCAVVSLGEQCVTGVLRSVREQGGAPQASLYGFAEKVSVTGAALANATLIRALDMNDHLAIDPNDGSKLGGHPSDMLGPILAVAEWKQLTGTQAIDAMLLAYESYGRAYALMGPELPWDHATAFGIAVPLAVSRLLKLTSEQMAHAVALGVSQCATLGGVRRGQLSHAKFLAGPWACERGLHAALMASHGVTGPLSIFEDSRGFDAGVACSGPTRARLTTPLGTHAMIEGVTIKGFPGMDTTQASAEAATRICAELSGGRGRLVADDIERVEMLINDHPMMVKQVTDPERQAPQSRETADHSHQYLLAVALLDGEVTPHQFAEGRWHDPALIALMGRMDIRPATALTRAAPGGFPCHLTVRLRDGRSATSEILYARGHARNRMSQDDVEAKFKRMVTPAMSSSQIAQTIDLVRTLGSAHDTSALAVLMAGVRV